MRLVQSAPRHRRDRHAARGAAAQDDRSVLNDEVVRTRFEHLAGEREDLLTQLAGGDDRGATAAHRASAGPSPEAVGDDRGVAVDDLDIVYGDAKLPGGDLRDRRLVALTVVVQPHRHAHASVGLEPDRRRVVAEGHLELSRAHRLRPIRGLLDRKSEPQATEPPGKALRVVLGPGGLPVHCLLEHVEHPQVIA